MPKYGVIIGIKSTEAWSGRAIVEAESKEAAREKVVEYDYLDLEWNKQLDMLGFEITDIENITEITGDDHCG